MSSILQSVGESLATVAAMPWILQHRLLCLAVGRAHACTWIGQRAARWSGDFGNAMRYALLRRVLKRVAEQTVISHGSIVTKADSELGKHVYLGLGCILGSVIIGDDTLIADHVCIPSGNRQHGIDRLDIPVWQQKGQWQTIRIGCDTWIGSNATILADVGSHCVVGAGSVVTKPVPDYAIVAGNPARQIGDRRDLAAKAQSDPTQATA